MYWFSAKWSSAAYRQVISPCPVGGRLYDESKGRPLFMIRDMGEATPGSPQPRGQVARCSPGRSACRTTLIADDSNAFAGDDQQIRPLAGMTRVPGPLSRMILDQRVAFLPWLVLLSHLVMATVTSVYSWFALRGFPLRCMPAELTLPEHRYALS